MLYKNADNYGAQFRNHWQNYNQDPHFYDNIDHLTTALINNDYKVAQKIVNEVQEDLIEWSGKKSVWHKYKKGSE